MRIKIASVAMVFALAAASLSPVRAATSSATLMVSVVVLNTCQAAITGSASPRDAAKVNCSSATPYSVSTSPRATASPASLNNLNAIPLGQVSYGSLSDHNQPVNAGAADSQAVLVTITY